MGKTYRQQPDPDGRRPRKKTKKSKVRNDYEEKRFDKYGIDDVIDDVIEDVMN